MGRMLVLVIVLCGCGGGDLDEAASNLGEGCPCASPLECVSLTGYIRNGHPEVIRDGVSICLRPASSGCPFPTDRGLALNINNQMSKVYCTSSCLRADQCPAAWACNDAGANGYCAP